jgi:hypothetical protein
MAIDIKTQNLFPIRRDKQIASKISYSSGTGGSSADVSINLSDYATINYVDTEISAIEASLYDSYDARAYFIPEVSLNDSYFKWVSGYLEPSIAGGGDITKVYVDGSLALRDADISAMEASLGDVNSILSYVNTSTYYDGSINAKTNKILFDSSIAYLTSRLNTTDSSVNKKADKNVTIRYKTSAYTLTSADNNFIIEASGTFAIYLPTNLDTGFQALIMNIGGGTISINASTGATVYTRDSSNDLTRRWTGATVYKRDSVSWAAIGDLN